MIAVTISEEEFDAVHERYLTCLHRLLQWVIECDSDTTV